jgi:hypothetical protein
MHQVLCDLSLGARLPCVLTRIEDDGTFIAVDKVGGIRPDGFRAVAQPSLATLHPTLAAVQASAAGIGVRRPI